MLKRKGKLLSRLCNKHISNIHVEKTPVQSTLRTRGADVCWRMLTYADVCSYTLVQSTISVVRSLRSHNFARLALQDGNSRQRMLFLQRRDQKLQCRTNKKKPEAWPRISRNSPLPDWRCSAGAEKPGSLLLFLFPLRISLKNLAADFELPTSAGPQQASQGHFWLELHGPCHKCTK